ncbi:type II secretion system major pseudopilin GspG [Aliamphritea hakodatensis]|uniref:type II secretion system major pseudopilin GspG n=1 Tax=Aliamphritea hakodatensis TaxID=2895352 RepID=UPI0022FDAD28|nr:type II secretion system major pseudopilin GspG [Aliamphritea hakodatensis]
MNSRKADFRSKSHRGFTLIELLIVMAIIALLAALVAPRLIGALGSSQTKQSEAQVALLSTALDSYRLDVGRYPSSDQGLAALIDEEVADSKSWRGPYLRKKELPKDPWGNAYYYAYPAEAGGLDYDVYSYGADSLAGGDGENADIGNW